MEMRSLPDIVILQVLKLLIKEEPRIRCLSDREPHSQLFRALQLMDPSLDEALESLTFSEDLIALELLSLIVKLKLREEIRLRRTSQIM